MSVATLAEKVSVIERLFEFLQGELADLDKLILQKIQGESPLIEDIGKHLIFSGGKRLRPILTLICSKLVDYQGDNHLKLAAAIEFIHSATLLHDDVVDQSRMRRGAVTANERWSDKASILVGDFLLSQAFKLMTATGEIKVVDAMARASVIISKGEVIQLESIDNYLLTKDRYIEVVSAKTAELFATACQVTGLLKNLPEAKTNALYEFGKNLGIAFQITDDALDYNASEIKLGKNLGIDFAEGKVTLPLILLFAEVAEPLTLKSESFASVQELMTNHKIYDKTLDIANEYLELAAQNLEEFADSEAKDLLKSLLKFAVERQY